MFTRFNTIANDFYTFGATVLGVLIVWTIIKKYKETQSVFAIGGVVFVGALATWAVKAGSMDCIVDMISAETTTASSGSN